ncbi:condensin complex subunit SMC2 [Cylindrobasidium torrendii FP15055 ss-10]|uniref:Structural maintenance of chromosomes protein n=1 Tax=Cylindrobasidium torrendii FP15055 ss-10 TaxID=1314674 RepID=A0A0D7BT55_9AGAR|nr:condensin complex subunit SMC2 [Cylindrobasidium torrendii FP15055 ss-10]
MRVKELVLDGFKSYPSRTIISNWDASFNAITGLNGSGKSNILDAIAWVLGITDFKVLRSDKQADLVYKRGNAGITRCSVSIIFDNTDPTNTPEHVSTAEITVTRTFTLPNQTKYLLNGRKADQKVIHDMFQSVGLNINNPNFVILQGKITKVLNMKPVEILSMIEEAAGTRMFETKKQSAKKTMAKKEKRIQEIHSAIDDDIKPKLARLREENKAYHEWVKLQDQLDATLKKCRALEWTKAQERIAKMADEHAEKKDELLVEREGIDEDARQVAETEKRKRDLVKQRDQELQKGGKINKLREQAEKLTSKLGELSGKIAVCEKSSKEESEKMVAAEKEISELEDALGSQREHVEDLQKSHQKLKDEQDARQSQLHNDENLLQSLLTGLGKDADQNGGGYLGQIAAANTRLTQARTDEETLTRKLDMKSREVKEFEAKCKAQEKDAGEGKKRLDALKKELEYLETSLSKCGWDADKEAKFNEDLNHLRGEVRRLDMQRNQARNGTGGLDFDYQSPPNFDRSKVRGTVGRWVKLDEAHHDKALALETAAGGRLFQVIIDDERVGKALLTQCKLGKRTMFIPLNKIESKSITKPQETMVRNQTQGKAVLALSLIKYPEELAPAMAYVFGNTFVCEDTETAKIVAFNSKHRAVTVQGDVYEPSGTLTGGSAARGSGILVRAQEFIRAEEALAAARQGLERIEEQGRQTQSKRDAFSQLQRNVEMKRHELGLAEGAVAGSDVARVQHDLAAAKEAITQLQADVKAAKEKQRLTQAEVKKLEQDMNEFKDNKEGKIDELRKDISKKKALIQKHDVLFRKHQIDWRTAAAELESAEESIERNKTELETMSTSKASIQQELKKLRTEEERVHKEHDDLGIKLAKEQEKVSRFDKELGELDEFIKSSKDTTANREARITKLQKDIEDTENQKTQAADFARRLEKEYQFIMEDKAMFGQPGVYDFSDTDVKTLRDLLTKLDKTNKTMKKKINEKAAHMMSDAEKRDEELGRNLNTILEDRRKIEEKMEDIDQSKKETLETVWRKVSDDFGDIFRELLPGNTAKLQVQEGKDLMDGLEVKVQLGTVWKQSLTELSGGQRSLIALSLIMALLQYKPAPMYILDEIDAALDLSHTQHIGHLFRTRFKGSQFIVVSLKDGLFNNANTLFRARFHDGVSIVERIGRTAGR